ncbi:hypothetical protein FDENT_4308 [Fusarium denticulatum]|uniref:Uncharacterized protein n=1 Tax=Fusarium denticulatum TaxID=48507 RepID=A0A8H5UFQ8_9HYPO|nr:hypothetical protein FDENT_4308 [Fusarium denticulatum]
MSKRNQPEGEAAGGGGPFSYHGSGRGGGHGRGRGGYNNGHNNFQGHGNWGNTPNYPTPHPKYNQNLPMGQGYNTYQFEPNVSWQPGNEPSNPFYQSHQASQNQQSQNNGGKQWGRRKKPKKSHEVEQASLCRVESDKGTAAPEIPKVSEGGGSQQKSHRELHHQVCGMCKLPGNEVIQCWAIGADGFTHGCAVCNSGEHETDKRQGFPKDVYQRIEILVKRRACLPPLKTAFWYNMMWKWVKKSPSTDVNHLFPWTTQFAIDVLNGDRKSAVEEALVNRRNNPDVESSEVIVDPATADWEKVKETYGGEPKNFFAKLKADNAAAQEQRVANASAQAQQGHAYVANERDDITLSSSQSGQHTSLVPSNSRWSRSSPKAVSQPRRETSPGRGPVGPFSTATSESGSDSDADKRLQQKLRRKQRIKVRTSMLGAFGMRPLPRFPPNVRRQ